MSRVSKYAIALIFSILANLLLFIQPVADAATVLGQSRQYIYINNPYTLYGLFLWPFIAGLGYYYFTSDKRLGFPLSVQLGTIGVSSFILIADSIPSKTSLILYSYVEYIQYFVTTMGFTFVLLVMVGVVQLLGLRVILGMEKRGQPDTVTLTVGMSLPDMVSLFDPQFLASHQLWKRTIEVEGVTLFSTRRNTGEEVALAIAKKDGDSTSIAFAATEDFLLYVTNTDNAKDIMDGLVRDVKERIHFTSPDREIGEPSQRDDQAYRAVMSRALRRTNTAFTRARSSLGRMRRRVSILVGPVPKTYFAIGGILGAMMLVVAYLNPPNVIEIFVILIMGLLLDFGIPIYQTR